MVASGLEMNRLVSKRWQSQSSWQTDATNPGPADFQCAFSYTRAALGLHVTFRKHDAGYRCLAAVWGSHWKPERLLSGPWV